MRHRQRIGRSFAIGTKAVTVGEFQKFHQAHPKIIHDYSKQLSPEPACPIIRVTWYDAAEYCRWLSDQEGFPEDQMCYPPVAVIEKSKKEGTPLKLPADYLSRTAYRLPTEAEWEYACRAGTRTSRYYGSAEAMLGRYAWYRGNLAGHTWPVGQKRPNDFGLFDMHGNAWQWCQGSARPYGRAQQEDKEDPTAVTPQLMCVLRGGSFRDHASNLRSACRNNSWPGYRTESIGLRVVRTYR
ncbi:MAG TPA: formylglycine-generating enzyme family protein, partial [Gemmataceae bacterium]|nr:formylglycine-generating enzyme family protein [Gemmataceae bacterium]